MHTLAYFFLEIKDARHDCIKMLAAEIRWSPRVSRWQVARNSRCFAVSASLFHAGLFPLNSRSWIPFYFNSLDSNKRWLVICKFR